LRPMDKDAAPLVFSSGKGWILFDGTFGAVMDSKPITEEAAKSLTSQGGLEMLRFPRLRDGRILDSAPMDKDSWPLVFNPGKGWEPFEGTFGAIGDSKPITDEEAFSLTSEGV
ncbi:MAG: hypothetical protein L0958_02880, partial [Candidatus Mariimomonas ferrooxydans]